MLLDQKSPLYREAGFTNLDRKTHIHDTDIATYRLNCPMGHFSNKYVLKTIYLQMAKQTKCSIPTMQLNVIVLKISSNTLFLVLA